MLYIKIWSETWGYTLNQNFSSTRAGQMKVVHKKIIKNQDFVSRTNNFNFLSNIMFKINNENFKTLFLLILLHLLQYFGIAAAVMRMYCKESISLFF